MPGQGGEAAVTVAGIVGGEEGAGGAELGGRDGHVGLAVLGPDVVAAREELACAVGSVFGAGHEPAHGGLEEAEHWEVFEVEGGPL